MNERLAKTIITALIALILCLLVLYGAVSETANTDRRALNAVYQRAFYETCELMNSLEGNLKKLSVASDQARQQELLGEIARQAQGTESNLAMLPAGAYTLTSTMKFVNQISDYAQALSKQLAKGKKLSDSDRAQLERLAHSATEFTLRLNEMLNRYNSGELVFTEYDFAFGDAEAAAPLSSPASDYPVLLYDGPFSDSAKSDEMKALTGKTVTADQAQEALDDFLFGEAEEIVFLGESGGNVPLYEFSLRYKGYDITAAITQTGGKVLWMLPETGVMEGSWSIDRCLESAQIFLKKRGFGNFIASDYQFYGGVLTVSLAPQENGAILYPDLIKAQISMKDGAVIGLETSDYYRNHVEREWQPPTLTRQDAIDALSPELTHETVQLALIPLNLEEKLCWEIRATDGEDEYLVYIDAETGAELKTYQLIFTPEGMLTK